MKWIECTGCFAEFRVISETSNTAEVQYCPYCGTDVELCEDTDWESNDYEE